MNKKLLKIFHKGVSYWNAWRKDNPHEKIDLRGFGVFQEDLSNIDFHDSNLEYSAFDKSILTGANFKGASLNKAELYDTECVEADFTNASLLQCNFFAARLQKAIFKNVGFEKVNLHYANLEGLDLHNIEFCFSNLRCANLSFSNLENANLLWTNLCSANLYKANLKGANLTESLLCKANLCGADISNCRVYGVSAWDVILDENTNQKGLIINEKYRDINPFSMESPITVDNLLVANFINMIYVNKNIRNLIEGVITKVVLILGRFTHKRKRILDCIREELLKNNYVGVIFDFEKPNCLDFIETVSVIAHLSKFIIADFTDAKIVLEEVPHIVRNIAVPVLPILHSNTKKEPVTLYNLRRNHRTVLPTFKYKSLTDIKNKLINEMIIPCINKYHEINSYQ